MVMAPEYRRLPQDVKPLHYNITLSELDLTGEHDWKYRGQVEIDLSVHNSTDKIVLNAYKISKLSASIDSGAVVTHISEDEETQRLVVHLNSRLTASANPVKLTLKYEAQIDGHLTGFYRSQELATGEQMKYNFCTQFQPSDARRAFPCFDEPDFKATFDLSIEVPGDANLTVVSNMPERESTPSKRDPSHKVVSFERTPVMSTYLLAWAIGDFRCIEKVIARRYSDLPLPIKVYTTPQLLQHGEFALQLAGRVVDYFADIFGMDYPLPKLDLLAITEMSDDAMENWGLIIFRATALVLDETATEPGVRTRVAYIIAHEIAHQWFGNLVTMTWWDELWLNEGFATWAGWDVLDHLYPHWDVWGQFVAEDMQEAFELDSLPSSHPVEVPVLDGLEVDSIFDDISYLKGASIVRMLMTYLGRDVFLRGLSDYFSIYMYQNTTAESLWSALEKASGEDVSLLMQPWIKTMGFPAVYVRQVDQTSIHVEQSPISASAGGDSPWFIPLLIQTSKGVVRHSFKAVSERLNLDSDLIKFNVDQQGYYRTQIDSESILRMSTSFESLSTRDKAGLVGDAMAMAVSGRDTSTSVLNLLEKLSMDADFVVWTSILSCLDQICLVFSSDSDIQRGLDILIGQLVRSRANKLSWHPAADETYQTQRLRPLLLTASGLAGDEQIVTEACQLFKAVQSGNDETQLHPFLRETCFGIATSKTGGDAVAFLEQLYKKTTSPHEREAIARAMAQMSSPREANDCLLSMFSGSIMTAQDLETLAISMAENPALPGVVWSFIQAEWDLVCERLEGSMAIFEPFIRRCLQTLTSFEEAEEVEAFFDDKDTLGYGRGLTVALDMIRANAAYRVRDVEVVRAWLRDRGLLGQ